MKILIDASGIVDKTTGVGQYSYQLIRNLAKIDSKNKYSILLQNKLSPDHKVFNIKNKNFTSVSHDTGFQNKLTGFRDGHKKSRNLGVCNG